MMARLKIILFNTFLFFGVFLMSLNAAALPYEKPVFALKFNITRVDVEVILNGDTVFSHNVNGFVTSEKPIPESVLNGENVLEVKIRNREADSDLFSGFKSADIEIVARERGAPLNQYTSLLHLKVDGTEVKEDVLKETHKEHGEDPILAEFGPQAIIAKRTAYIDTGVPRPKWEGGAAIEDNENNFSSLMNEYRRVYQALKSEDMKKLKEIYKPVAEEFAAAYHYDDVDEGHRIIGTGSLVGDNEWNLADFDELINSPKFDFRLEVFPNGKLARIVDQNGRSPIIYLNKKKNMVSAQKFSFYKDTDGNWIMAR